MSSPLSSRPPFVAASVHLAGFLSASFLIDQLWRFAAAPPAAAWPTAGASLPVPPEGMGAWAVVLFQEAVFPAMLEELFFRGLVFEFVRRAKGVGWAIGVSAALFGLAHPGLAHTGAAGLLGLYLGALRATSGLALPVLAHVANNLLALAAALNLAGRAPTPESSWAAPQLWLALVMTGISLAVLRQEMRSGAPVVA